MIASFFRSLEARRVAYLLISGQATVLYGAATFSEDIDLWVEPSPENIMRLQGALSAVGARYYKLTPALDAATFDSGHGFHFILGGDMGEAIFLDVMGRPPRVPSFSAARRASRHFQTDWGTLPTLGIRDLIELKKTQRLADYPIISTLTLRLLEEATSPAEMLSWAACNLFTVETFFLFNQQNPRWTEMPPEGMPPSLAAVAGWPVEDIPDQVVAEATEWMNTAIARHQLADRQHWRGIIAQLRELRSQGKLMAEGAAV